MTNKNGFEIRADILKLAQDHLQTEFSYGMSQYDQSMTNPDWKGGEIVKPTFPSTERVLETAKAMYTFVNTQVQHQNEYWVGFKIIAIFFYMGVFYHPPGDFQTMGLPFTKI